MDEYKLVYETVDGGRHVSEWMLEKEARKEFNKLRDNRKGEGSKIVWCELIYSSLDEDAADEEIVVESFENNVIEIFGQKIAVPKQR